MDDYDYGYESSVSSDSEVATKRIKLNTSEVIIVVVASILIATTIPIEPPRIKASSIAVCSELGRRYVPKAV